MLAFYWAFLKGAERIPIDCYSLPAFLDVFICPVLVIPVASRCAGNFQQDASIDPEMLLFYRGMRLL